MVLGISKYSSTISGKFKNISKLSQRIHRSTCSHTETFFFIISRQYAPGISAKLCTYKRTFSNYCYAGSF
jgi:hypothetical protein